MKRYTLITDLLCISISDLVKIGAFVRKDGCCGTIMLYTKSLQKIDIDFLVCSKKQNNSCIFHFEWNNSQMPIVNDIKIGERNSNLGLGKILYFICPESGSYCRKLYFDFETSNWKCRAAFNTPFLYPIQICTKTQRYRISYETIVKQLNETKHSNRLYKGHLSSKTKKIMLLQKKKQLMYLTMISPLAFPKRMRHLFPDGLEKDVKNHIVSYKAFLKNLG